MDSARVVPPAPRTASLFAGPHIVIRSWDGFVYFRDVLLALHRVRYGVGIPRRLIEELQTAPKVVQERITRKLHAQLRSKSRSMAAGGSSQRSSRSVFSQAQRLIPCAAGLQRTNSDIALDIAGVDAGSESPNSIASPRAPGSASSATQRVASVRTTSSSEAELQAQLDRRLQRPAVRGSRRRAEHRRQRWDEFRRLEAARASASKHISKGVDDKPARERVPYPARADAVEDAVLLVTSRRIRELVLAWRDRARVRIEAERRDRQLLGGRGE